MLKRAISTKSRSSAVNDDQIGFSQLKTRFFSLRKTLRINKDGDQVKKN